MEMGAKSLRIRGLGRLREIPPRFMRHHGCRINLCDPFFPPFFTPSILELLSNKYGLKGIDTVETDCKSIMSEN